MRAQEFSTCRLLMLNDKEEPLSTMRSEAASSFWSDPRLKMFSSFLDQTFRSVRRHKRTRDVFTSKCSRARPGTMKKRKRDGTDRKQLKRRWFLASRRLPFSSLRASYSFNIYISPSRTPNSPHMPGTLYMCNSHARHMSRYLARLLCPKPLQNCYPGPSLNGDR